jgi:hypothetical protein
MRTLLGLTAILLVTGCLCAQQIPAGTLLPTMLDNTVDSEHSKPGEEISTKLMQDVPLPDGGKIKRGAKVLGHVVSVAAASTGQPTKIVVQFDRIEIDKHEVSIATSLRALASMQAVATAKQPVNANSGNGTSVWDWNMIQVGGQGVFNGQRIVKSQTGEVVGKVPEPGAVLAVPMPNPSRGCAGASVNTAEQAFWVFSTDACGVYGYKHLALDRSAGDTSPDQITLQSSKNITIRGGSGWLLQVVSAPAASSGQ